MYILAYRVEGNKCNAAEEDVDCNGGRCFIAALDVEVEALQSGKL